MITYKTHDTKNGIKKIYELIRYLPKEKAFDVRIPEGEDGYYENNVLTFPIEDIVYANGVLDKSSHRYQHIELNIDFSKIEESDRPILVEIIKYIFESI